jgi:hypothetical protein
MGKSPTWFFTEMATTSAGSENNKCAPHRAVSALGQLRPMASAGNSHFIPVAAGSEQR